MSKKVLIIGSSGSGKTYISSKLKDNGINAVDADSIEGLHGWYDGKGNKVTFPRNAGPDFLNNHSFRWNRNFLQEYLKNQEEIYLFGLSGNVFGMIDLFDKTYFLKVDPKIIETRLTHESRENPMGKTPYQRKKVLIYAKKIENKAKKLNIEFIDGTLSPIQIYDLIKN